MTQPTQPRPRTKTARADTFLAAARGRSGRPSNAARLPYVPRRCFVPLNCVIVPVIVPVLALALVLVLALSLVVANPAGAQGLRADGQVSPTPAAVKHGLVVLVQFPDVQHGVNREFVEERFAGHLNRYVKEMSYNTVSLGIDVTRKWYTLPERVSRYSISSRNLEVDRSRIVSLIDDALDAVGQDVDLAKYSFIALMLGAKVSEYGMVGLCGYPGMLGWSTEDVYRTKSGRLVHGGVAIFTSQAHLGTL
ncbi:MAG: hypothetical protein Q8S17_03200, partial [Humidesulfovibrio sp.]|nr:hypothetical protein [Humidesulfovibrio sp.]